MNGSGEFAILDKQIDVLRTGGILPEKDILNLCKKVSKNGTLLYICCQYKCFAYAFVNACVTAHCTAVVTS